MEGFSIVVPFLNEKDCITEYCKKMDEYAGKTEYKLELIFVDDGSSDSTDKEIKAYHFCNIENVKLITLSKNFGSHAAIRAGITQAQYDICTFMGCDLQEPIEMIDIAYKKIKEGYDAVYIEKETIEVSFLNRLFSKIYSNLMRKYAVENYGSGGISTIIFDRKIIDYLNENQEINSSVHLQIMNAGFRSCTVPMIFGKRMAGTSKWTLKKKIKLFIDSFVGFSFMPVRLVSIIGVLLFFIGVVGAIVTIINKCVNPAVPVGYSTLITVILLGFGITNISLGIIAEYLWRTFDAARKRPPYIISSIEIV